MAGFVASDYTATITFLGFVPRREGAEIEAEAVREMPLTLAGFDKEFHAGVTRPSCSRVANIHPEGTEIRNSRQMSILSEEEISEIAKEMGLPRLDPSWLGASIVLKGIPDFSHVPPASRLLSASGVTIVVDVENGPCNYPAKTIDTVQPGFGKAFKPAAKGRRGVTASVERGGALRVGDELKLFVPDQRGWLG